MLINRRHFAAGAALLPVLSLTGCGFQDIKNYVATIKGFVDAVTPIIETLAPAQKARIDQIRQDFDAAADAFAKLPDSTLGSSDTAQTIAITIISLTNDALTIAEAIPSLPTATRAILASVQLLLGVIASFFGIPVSPAAQSFAVGTIHAPHPLLFAEAKTRLDNASDKDRTARDAAAEIQAWIRSH